MAVKASPEGIRKMDRVVTERDLRGGEYAKIYMDIHINTRTVRDFLKGREVGKDSAEQIIKYLGFQREDIIPDSEWFKDLPQSSLEDLWQELYALAKYAPQRLGLIPAQIETAAMDDDGEEKFLTQIVSKSPVWIEMEAKVEGHLILLDRDATGEIIALSPSPYIPVTTISTGKHRFPHKSSPKRAFKPATLGDEVFIAIVLSELPSFDWCAVGEKCVQLEVEEMQELLSHVKKTPPEELIRSPVKIGAA